jgi:hypothetical protein
VHLIEHALDALGLFSAQVALADLGPHEFARTCVLESLGCGLVCLDLWHFSLHKAIAPFLAQGQCAIDFWSLGVSRIEN